MSSQGALRDGSIYANSCTCTCFFERCRFTYSGVLWAPLACRALLSAKQLGCLQFSTILDSYKQHSKGWNSTFNKYAEGEAGFLVGTMLYACLTVSSGAVLFALHGRLTVRLTVLGCLAHLRSRNVAVNAWQCSALPDLTPKIALTYLPAVRLRGRKRAMVG